MARKVCVPGGGASDVFSVSPPALRAALQQTWADSSAYRKDNGVYPRMRLGLLLWRVKREQLYKLWGYKSLVQYLNTELGGLSTMTANFYTFAAHRLWRFFGYSLAEMEQLDKIPNNRLRRCISLADTRAEFEQYLQAGPEIFRRNGSYLLSPTDTLATTTWPRKKFCFNGQSFRLLDYLLSHIAKCLEITKDRGRLHPEQALTIMALTYQVLIDHLPRDVKRLEAALRREFLRYDLPVEAADLSRMRWHRTRTQSKKSATLHAVAHTLTENSLQ